MINIYVDYLTYSLRLNPPQDPLKESPRQAAGASLRAQSTRVTRRGPGPARPEGGCCGLAKSPEPSSLEKDVGNLTAEAASFAARK